MLSTESRVSNEIGRPFLPRAMSAWSSEQGLNFMLEVVGPGTACLADLRVDDSLFLLGPLGRGFKLPGPAEGAQPLLIAGGIGVPPLLALERELIATGQRPLVMAGFRSSQFVAAASLFQAEAQLAVDDGSDSQAHSGRVTDLLQKTFSSGGRPPVYACGPPAMLETVRQICTEVGVVAQLALEAPMACGYGACFGCAVKTSSGYIRLCIDGPAVASDLIESVE